LSRDFLSRVWDFSQIDDITVVWFFHFDIEVTLRKFTSKSIFMIYCADMASIADSLFFCESADSLSPKLSPAGSSVVNIPATYRAFQLSIEETKARTAKEALHPVPPLPWPSHLPCAFFLSSSGAAEELHTCPSFFTFLPYAFSLFMFWLFSM
jgi:hypothetical protein